MSENKNKNIITEIIQTIIVTETLDENNLAFVDLYLKLGKEKILDNEKKLVEDMRFGEIDKYGGKLSIRNRFITYRTINKVEDLEVNKYMKVVDTKITENTTNITEYIYDNLSHYYLTLISEHKITFLEMNNKNLIIVYNDMMEFIKSFRDLKYNVYEALLCLDIRIQYKIDIFDYKTELIDDIKINTDNIQFSIYQLLKYNFNNYYYSIYNALSLESEDYPVTPVIEKILKNNEYYFILILFYILNSNINFEQDIVKRSLTIKKPEKYGLIDSLYIFLERENFIKNFKNIINNTKEINLELLEKKKQFSIIELHYHILDGIEEINEMDEIDENFILNIMSNMILEIGENAFNKIISIEDFLGDQEYIEFQIFSQFIYNDLVPIQLMKNKEIIKLKQNQIIFDSLKEDFKVYNFVDYILMKSPLGVKLNIYNSNLNIINEIDNLSEINIEFSLTFLNDYDDFFKKIFEKSQDIRKKKYENSINQEEFNYTDRENINQKKELKNDYGILIKRIKSLEDPDRSTIKIFKNIFGFNYIYTTKSNLPININQNINVNEINDYINYFKEINRKIKYENQKGEKLKFDDNSVEKKIFNEILEKNYPNLIPILDFEEFVGTYIILDNKNKYIDDDNILELLENIIDSIPDINNDEININHWNIIYNIINDGFLNIYNFSDLNTRYNTKYDILDIKNKIEMDVKKQINYIVKYLYSTERFSNLDKYYYKLILFNNLYILFNGGRFPIDEDVVVECINNNTFNFKIINDIFPIFLEKKNVNLLEKEIKEINKKYINPISKIKENIKYTHESETNKKTTKTIVNKIENYIKTIEKYKTYVDRIEFIITRLADKKEKGKPDTIEHKIEYITSIEKSHLGEFNIKIKSTMEIIENFNIFINGDNLIGNFEIIKKLDKSGLVKFDIAKNDFFIKYYENKLQDILLIPDISLSPIDPRYKSLIHLNKILEKKNLKLDTSLDSDYNIPLLSENFCNTFEEENVDEIIENYFENKIESDFKKNLILHPQNIRISPEAKIEFESENIIFFDTIDENIKKNFSKDFNTFIGINIGDDDDNVDLFLKFYENIYNVIILLIERDNFDIKKLLINVINKIRQKNKQIITLSNLELTDTLLQNYNENNITEPGKEIVILIYIIYPILLNLSNNLDIFTKIKLDNGLTIYDDFISGITGKQLTFEINKSLESLQFVIDRTTKVSDKIEISSNYKKLIDKSIFSNSILPRYILSINDENKNLLAICIISRFEENQFDESEALNELYSIEYICSKKSKSFKNLGYLLFNIAKIYINSIYDTNDLMINPIKISQFYEIEFNNNILNYAYLTIPRKLYDMYYNIFKLKLIKPTNNIPMIYIDDNFQPPIDEILNINKFELTSLIKILVFSIISYINSDIDYVILESFIDTIKPKKVVQQILKENNYFILPLYKGKKELNIVSNDFEIIDNEIVNYYNEYNNNENIDYSEYDTGNTILPNASYHFFFGKIDINNDNFLEEMKKLKIQKKKEIEVVQTIYIQLYPHDSVNDNWKEFLTGLRYNMQIEINRKKHIISKIIWVENPVNLIDKYLSIYVISDLGLQSQLELEKVNINEILGEDFNIFKNKTSK